MGAHAPRLLGRDAEQAALRHALAVVERGRAQAVGLTGEPGIGKSRLLAELGRQATGRGHAVLTARATELERDVPFALWVEALDGREDVLAPDALAHLREEELADLAVALPEVGRRTGVAPAVTVERHRVGRAVRALLGAAAASRPVCLLLDDVHWADPASADVLALLLHRPPRRPVLLALAARRGRAPALEEALLAAAGHGDAAQVEVGPLAREAAEGLLPPTLGPAARAQVVRESGGNPFYLQALAGAGPGVPAAAPAVGVPGVPGVPRGVLAALAGEVARLGPEARLLAQGAAVAGDPFDLWIAAAAAGLGEGVPFGAVDELCAADLAAATDDPRRLRFRHPLVRRAVYESTGGGWRLAAHERAAAALEAAGAAPAQRAHHVERAARPGDLAAVELLVRAAQEVADAAPASAAGWYEAALRLLPEGAEHADRRRTLLVAHAGMLESAGRAAQARDALRRVLALLPEEPSAERVGLVVRLAELEALWGQRPDAARRLLDAEGRRLGEMGPGPSAALRLALAAERAERGDQAATRVFAEAARADAEAAGDRALAAFAAATAADAAHGELREDDPARLAAADAQLAEAARLVHELPDDELAARLGALLTLGVAHLFTGALDAADGAARRGLALARRTRQGLLAQAFVCLRGLAANERGRLDAARADEEEALESALITGNVQVEFWATTILSWVAVARGEVDAAVAHGEAARRLLGTGGWSQAGYALADARLAAGDARGAVEVLEETDWVRPQMWPLDRLKAVEVAVRALLAVGRLDEAEAWARRAPAEGGGRRSGLPGALVAQAQAAVLLARGRPEEAARVALRGARCAGDAGARVRAARCRTLAGEALIAADDGVRARGELRRAADELGACGAWGLRDDAVRALRRLGERPRALRPPGPGPDHDGPLAALTPREREVAGLVAEGRTNAQIAHRLGLSERTVEKHVSSALARLGLASRAGIPALLART